MMRQGAQGMLAQRMSYIKATREAAALGRCLTIFMGIFDYFYNFWFILIAFFIYIGASEEEKSTEINLILEGVKIKILCLKKFNRTSDMSIESLWNIYSGSNIWGIRSWMRQLKDIVHLQTYKKSQGRKESR